MSKGTRITLIIASVLLCSCPGFFLCFFGPAVTTEQIISGGVNYADLAGWSMICLGSLFVLLPIPVVLLTKNRVKPDVIETDELPADWDEPLPPPL